ncbi:MAG TPA: hypothetical protein VM618_03160, partial [Acidimicrobiia bacterium]|nr:hypothetical protein [Acidimicrobiia bacterium]
MASTVYDFERDAARRWGPVEGVELLRKAESFARAAWLAIEEGDREIATDVAALAAVTAADAVACIRLGKRSAAPARREAVRLLLQADPTATEAARVVDQLLQLRQQG